MHAVSAEDVRDLVRVRDDRRRPERENEAGELVRQELRRLQMHVRVYEARDDVPAGGVDGLAANTSVVMRERSGSFHDFPSSPHW